MMLTIRGQQTLTATYTLHFERKGGPEEMMNTNLYLQAFTLLSELSRNEYNPRPEESKQFQHNSNMIQIELTDHSTRIFAVAYNLAFSPVRSLHVFLCAA